MKRIQLLICSLVAIFMLSANSAWAAYVKVTAENGTVSWIYIEGNILGTNFEVGNDYRRCISYDTTGLIDLNEVWSENKGSGIHYQVTCIQRHAFYECINLTSIIIPSSVTSIGEQAFYKCNVLKKVIVKDIAAWCNISFTDNPLFYAHHLYSDENTEITNLILPSNVTSIGNKAFYGCSGLISVTIGNSVTSIGGSAFSDCSGLTSVTIGNSVTSIGGSAFYRCISLASVIIGNSVTTIGKSALRGCSSLTSVTIPNSVTSIGNQAFRECSGLTSIVIESGNAVYDSRENCNAIIETASNTLIAGCKNTKIPSSVTSIGNYAFSSCSDLTSIEIPNSVTNIGIYAFESCYGLTSIVIPSSVTSIEEKAFYYCNALKKVIVKDIAAWCKISFGDVTANPLNYSHRLYSDENTEITNLFIPNTVTTIGDYAFRECSGLTSVNIPSSVTSIGYYAFYGCIGLTSVVIPSSVTSLGGYTFSGCIGLTSIEIPSSVTSIGNCAFFSCSGLTSVVIPSSVTSIGNSAFHGCSGLASVTSYLTNIFETGTNAFSGCDNATLYVPKGLANFYRITADWNRFKKIEEMLEVIPGTFVMSCNNKGKVKINGTTEFTNNVGEISVYDGMENTFVLQPNDNCELRQVLIDGLDVTSSVENNQLTTKVHEGSKMIVMFDKTSSDVNGDGMVDISDVVRLVNIILGQ